MSVDMVISSRSFSVFHEGNENECVFFRVSIIAYWSLGPN